MFNKILLVTFLITLITSTKHNSVRPTYHRRWPCGNDEHIRILCWNYNRVFSPSSLSVSAVW